MCESQKHEFLLVIPYSLFQFLEVHKHFTFKTDGRCFFSLTLDIRHTDLFIAEECYFWTTYLVCSTEEDVKKSN